MSADMLADLDALRRRTRGDRHAYAFPLFLFGSLILLAPLCYASFAPPESFELVEIELGPFPQFTSVGFLAYPDLVGWYWVITIIGGLWLTSWWYRQRARRHGVETDVRVPTVAAGAAFAGFVMWQPVFGAMLRDLNPHGPYSSPAVNLPILFGSAALAAATGQWSIRRTSWPRAAGVAVTVLLATVSFGALEAYLIRGWAALVIIAAGLLVLAWAERSVLLAIVATLFTGIGLLVNLYDVENVWHRLGWSADLWDEQARAWQNLLVPGVVLLAGGVSAAVRDRR